MASGVVVDERGEPIAGASVDAYQVRGGLGRSSFTSETALRGSRVITRADGRFEVRSKERVLPTDERESLYVRATADGYGSRRIAVRPAATGLVVTLAREGSLAIVVPGVAPAAVGELDFVLFDADYESYRPRITPEGRSWKALAPGIYSLTIEFGTYELASVDGLVVPPGGPCLDARLASFELPVDIELREHVLQVASGAVPRTVDVHFDLAKDSQSRFRRVVDGRISVPHFSLLERVVVQAEGYVAVDVTDLPSGAAISLAPETIVEVDFVGKLDREAGLELWIMALEPRLPGTDLRTSLELPKAGPMRLRLPGPGRYRVIFRPNDSYRTIAECDFEVSPGAQRVAVEVP